MTKIQSPDDTSLRDLCDKLRSSSDALDASQAWPAEQLRWCGKYGVFEWFTGRPWGGQQWSEADIVRGYLALSEACLTTTFIITQRTGALQRIERSDNDFAKTTLLPPLVRGSTFATVGISHLTTSRRYVAQPVLRAVEEQDCFVLDGYSPWITGAAAAESVVVGATLDDQRQILIALPMNLPGIEIPPAEKLVGLSASQTGPVYCHEVRVEKKWLLAGPVMEVMKQGVGARTGGLQTSTLAIGMAQAPIQFLERQAQQRSDLAEFAAALRREWTELRDDLMHASENDPRCSDADMRTRANSFVLRASQAALATAKGTGYVVGHPAGRWCREALFFLVWSCPQPVLAANLCEFSRSGA
jgi:alkylation response protein AidB-like acyl-CoA dehydrogenase